MNGKLASECSERGRVQFDEPRRDFRRHGPGVRRSVLPGRPVSAALAG